MDPPATKQNSQLFYPEKRSAEESSSHGTDPEVIVDPVLEKRVWRKLDIWILPAVSMFYLLSFLDRTNIGNARVAGLQRDLNMTDTQYSIVLTASYVPYVLAELPSNLLLKAVGPNLMLPTMLTLCGVVTTLQGVVHNYAGILICQFFLGLLAGGVFPGIVLYLSFFYPRQRLQWRISAFFSAASLSGAFSGLLAFGIINLDGKGNKPGWAWIFILEGLFTVLFGVVSYMILPATPSTCRFFDEKEREYVIAKLKEDGATGSSDEDDKFTWAEVGKAFTLPQVWMLAFIFLVGGAVLFGLTYFTPSIIEGLGYTATRAQLLSVPPFAAAFLVAMIGAYVSDKYRCRGYTAIFSSILCVIGFGIFLSSTAKHIQYGSLFLSIAGIYLVAPTLSTWSANNAAPHTRRATAIAFGFINTNLGGILATWLLGSLSPPPHYTLASRILLAFSASMVIVCAMNTWYLKDQNKKKELYRRTHTREQERPGLGDKSAWFEYAL